MSQPVEIENRIRPYVFRPSQPGSRWWILARSLVYAAIIWSVTLWVIPHYIKRLEQQFQVPGFSFPGQATAAILLFAAGSAIGLWAMWTMSRTGKGTPLPTDCARELVVAGVYRYVRNPMAIGGLTQGAAVSIGLGSWCTLAYTLFGMVLWNFFVRPVEERDLLSRFGKPYEDYCAQVKCWLPTWQYQDGEPDEG